MSIIDKINEYIDRVPDDDEEYKNQDHMTYDETFDEPVDEPIDEYTNAEFLANYISDKFEIEEIEVVDDRNIMIDISIDTNRLKQNDILYFLKTNITRFNISDYTLFANTIKIEVIN